MQTAGNLLKFIVECIQPKEALRRARVLGLGSFNRQKRENARLTVRQMGSDMLPFLVTVIEERKRWRAHFRFLLVTALAVALASALLSHFHRFDIFFLAQVVSITMSIVSLLCFSLDTTITPSRIEKEAVTLLAETADIQKIPMLLSVVGHLDAKSRESVQAALTHLLPTVTLSDSHLFDEETRLRLLARLEGTARSWPYYSDVPVDYVLAIIQCLSSLEEQRALTHLVKLNASIQLNKTSETLAVAAKEAIPVIEAAKGRNKLAGSLVRPAECPNSSSLLQPAGSPAGEEENLLYASSRTQ